MRLVNTARGAMNELEQLRQEAEHLKNAIREGRKAACDTSLAQVVITITIMFLSNVPFKATGSMEPIGEYR